MIAELHDGTRLEFPDGTAPEVVQTTVKRVTAERAVATRKQAGEMALEGTNMLERGMIGAGKTVATIGRGAQQLMGGGPSAEEVRETKDRDSALNSGAALAGQIGAYLPTLLIPGANTFGGAAAIGAGTGALQEAEGAGDRIKNTVIGAGASLGGKAIGDKVASALSSKLASSTAAEGAKQSQNAVRDATLAASREAGYVVPPSAVNQSFLGRRLESVAGKAAMGQEASVRNQQVTNALARKGLGMADDAPIDQAALEAIRKTEGKAYRDVAALSNDAAEALENWKQAKFDSTSYRKFYDRSADPSALAKAKAASADAKQWFQFLESEATAAGRSDLIPALRAANVSIAKTHTVERALNDSVGDVSSRKLGQMLAAGKPLSGELETAARFAQGFSKYAADGAKVPTPGVSKSEAITAAILGTLGGSAAGPAGLMAGALPLVSGPIRSALLSQTGQRMMAAPSSYAAPASARIAAALAQNPQLRAAIPGLAGGGSPGLIEAFQ